jgi:diguanylate cyclase (GGDEF)-like protein/hemerythrin-like metal-binding protein
MAIAPKFNMTGFPSHSPDVDPRPASCNHGPLLATLTAKVDELSSRLANDALTGAASRASLEVAAQRELARLESYGHPTSLIACDLDGFKALNDAHGHQAGDEALKRFAAALIELARDVDLVARWGGDEFVVLLPNTGVVTARIIAQGLCDAVSGSALVNTLSLSASFGVAQAMPSDSWQVWFERADTALIQAKRDGKNRVVVAPVREPADSVALGCLQLVWRDAYRCGNVTIDSQHEALFQSANELLSVAMSGNNALIRPLLEALLAECRQHFADEERVLLWAGYTGLEGHARIHGRLLEEAGRLHARSAEGSVDPGDVIAFVTRELIANHVLRDDRMHFPFIGRLPFAGDPPPQ